MSYVSPLLNLLISSVQKAANSLNRDFSEIEKLQSSIKGYKEFVVSSYGKIERELQKELSRIKPDFAFAVPKSPRPRGPHFVVAPLDGLSNFAHGIAHFAISVAVCDGDNVIAGVVYNPATDELFFAEKGKGAYKEGSRNAERLRVSARKELKEALVSTLVNYKKDSDDYKKIHNNIICATDNVRVFGAISLDLAYVAAGKLDAAVALNNNFHEFAAGALIVKEAGGYVYDMEQASSSANVSLAENSGNLIAVNANLNKKVYELIKK